MKQLIEKAMEGGYHPPTHGLLFDLDRLEQIQRNWRNAGVKREQNNLEDMSVSAGYGEGFRDCSIILDPKFWSCLARATGMREEDIEKKKWMYTALNFHELNFREGWDSAMNFLKELLK